MSVELALAHTEADIKKVVKDIEIKLKQLRNKYSHIPPQLTPGEIQVYLWNINEDIYIFRD